MTTRPYMNVIKAMTAGLLVITPLLLSAAESLDPQSSRAARCVGIFAYSANWFMLQDNEGAAKVMAGQMARSQTALFSKYYANGAVAGVYAEGISAVVSSVKPYFDARPDELLSSIDTCVVTTEEMVAVQRARGVKMWGRSFEQMVTELTINLLRRMGLSE